MRTSPLLLAGLPILFASVSGDRATSQTAWTYRPAQGSAWSLALAHDAARQRTLALQYPVGVLGPVELETWEWDGTRWSTRSSAMAPLSPLTIHAVGDAGRARVLLLAAVNGGNTETWEWDGVAWLQRTPPTPAPFAAPMAYDGARQRVVLVGRGQTWEWDGADWLRRTPTTSPPGSGRRVGDLAWDAVRRQVVLFGGYDPQLGLLSDTWEWDGANWHERFPANVPPARAEHAMAYDPTRQRVVMVGGATALVDTWEWDGTDWTRATPATPAPSGRLHRMVFDPRRQRIVLVGGGTSLGAPDNAGVWEWDGVDWAERSAGERPAPREFHGLAHDVARQRTVLFGGWDFPALDDTWEWDGVRWTSRPTAVRPQARIHHAMVYDGAGQRVLVFGGQDANLRPLGDTWLWDGNRWTRPPPAASPSPRSAAAVAYDSIRARTVLFGGWDNTATFNDTWEWDGATWQRKAPATVPALQFGTAAFDVRRAVTVVFGAGQTWEWDGADWARRRPQNAPPAAGPMAYDPTLGVVVMFSDRPYSDVTWEYDGLEWRRVPLASGPGARVGHALVWNAAIGRIVLFGGEENLGYTTRRLADTWVYGADLAGGVSALGSGCAGTAGQPSLGWIGAPWPGNPGFGVAMVSARPSATAGLVLSTTPAMIALGAGCVLRLEPTAAFASLLSTTNPAGAVDFALPVPLGTAGIGFWAQGVVVDPLGAWQGLALTGGIAVRIGH